MIESQTSASPQNPKFRFETSRKPQSPFATQGQAEGADLEKPQRDAAGNPGSITMAIIRLMITDIYIYKRKDYYQ